MSKRQSGGSNILCKQKAKPVQTLTRRYIVMLLTFIIIFLVVSKMRPLVIIIVFTTVFRFSGVRGIGVEHRAAYDRVIECMSTATHSAQPGKHVPFQTIICPAFKV